MAARLTLVAAACLLMASLALADYDVNVDLKNVSGQEKTDWPVVLKVYTVLGRNLPAGSVNPNGFHVYDPSGKEVPHAIEVIPPDDVYGNDELIFIVPKLADGQTATYRVTNTKEKSALRQSIDLVGSAQNLIANGGFEKPSAKEGSLDGFVAPAEQDSSVRHGGKASLRLSAEGATVSTTYAKQIELHKGSWYYFGVWSKTENVARFGYQAGPGASVNFTYADPPTTKPADTAFGFVMPQCSTRDWLKCTFEGGRTDWGMDRYTVQATGSKASLEFTLPQPKHYYMEPGKTKGTWWLDDAVLIEQPEANVRFDAALAKQVKDGLFVFTRGPEMPLGKLQEVEKTDIYKFLPDDKYETLWVQMPYAHEALKSFDLSILKGQRASFCVGLYHTREIKDVTVAPAGLALEGPGGKLPVETVEYCPGYIGPSPSRYMPVVGTADKIEPVDPPGDKGVRYFFVTFLAPSDAKPGKYTGAIEVKVDGKLVQSVPTTLRVQDMAQPVIKDTYVGLIYNGGLPDMNDMLKQYARSGFTQIMWFCGWLPHAAGADGKQHINVPELDKKMKLLASLGIAGCGLYTDVQVDDRPAGHVGWMMGAGYAAGNASPDAAPAKAATEARKKADDDLKAAQAAAKEKPDDEALKKAVADKQAALKEAGDAENAVQVKLEPIVKAEYGRILTELDTAAKAHPDWPRFIYMNWDEATPARPKMGWTKDFIPDAITTLDMQFTPFPSVQKYYNTPAFDDPADWTGPELLNWVRKQGNEVGLCGAADTAEADRYQAGMLMITCGFKYFHAWHIRGGHTPGQMAYDKDRKQTLRGHEMICWARGMDDLKTYRLLKDALDQAKKSGKNAQAVKAAEDYLAGILKVWTADQRKSWTLQPYLGTAWSWGYEQFYDDWQEQMAKHAAAVLGVRWVD